MKRAIDWFKNRISYIRKMSQLRLFAIVTIIIVIPIICISGFSFNLVINEARNRYIYSLNMGTMQLASTLSAELGNLLSTGRTIIANNGLKAELQDYRRGAAGYADTAEKINASLLEYENTCFAASSLLPKIALITAENEVFGNQFAGEIFEKKEFLNEVKMLYGTNSNVKWTSDAEIFSLDKSGYSDCLYLMLAMRDSQTFRTIATVVLQMRVNVLASRILPNMFSYQTAVITSNSGDRIVELDYLGISGEFQDWIDVDSIELKSNQTIEKTANDTNCIISNYAISKTSWNIITISNMESYTTLKQVHLLNFTLAVGAILILAFVFAFRFSERFMKPVVDLNNQMKLVKEGNLNAHLEPSSNDEIGELTRQFNDMVNHINHLIELNKRKEEEKRISDMKFLQTQINPHFIYNTLTLLRYSVLTSNKKQADDLIIALNNILRYALSSGSQYVTLNHALKWIKNYLVIVNCSMLEPIEVIYDIEKGTGDCQIIRMLIQPLVENAAFHGLKNCQTQPKLRISSRTDGNDLIITIWDNGPGFDTIELSKHKSGADTKSIGVENVDQRIQLYYGEQYGVKYRSLKEGLPEGTEAIMVMPNIKKEDGDVLINEYTDS